MHYCTYYKDAYIERNNLNVPQKLSLHKFLLSVTSLYLHHYGAYHHAHYDEVLCYVSNFLYLKRDKRHQYCALSSMDNDYSYNSSNYTIHNDNKCELGSVILLYRMNMVL